MHYHREFTCKRDITLANPQHKICCSLGYKYFLWKFLLQIFVYSWSASFSCKYKVKFNAFLKNHIFLYPRFYNGKLSIICYFLLVLHNYCTSTNNSYVFSWDKISWSLIKFKMLRFWHPFVTEIQLIKTKLFKETNSADSLLRSLQRFRRRSQNVKSLQTENE